MSLVNDKNGRINSMQLVLLTIATKDITGNEFHPRYSATEMG